MLSSTQTLSKTILDPQSPVKDYDSPNKSTTNNNSFKSPVKDGHFISVQQYDDDKKEVNVFVGGGIVFTGFIDQEAFASGAQKKAYSLRFEGNDKRYVLLEGPFQTNIKGTYFSDGVVSPGKTNKLVRCANGDGTILLNEKIETILSCSIQIAKYLSKYNEKMAHLDIKAPNILIEMNEDAPYAELADFDCQVAIGKELKRVIGTTGHIAPEILNLSNDKADPLTITGQEDIWSFSAMVIHLVTKRSFASYFKPFSDDQNIVNSNEKLRELIQEKLKVTRNKQEAKQYAHKKINQSYHNFLVNNFTKNQEAIKQSIKDTIPKDNTIALQAIDIIWNGLKINPNERTSLNEMVTQLEPLLPNNGDTERIGIENINPSPNKKRRIDS